MSTAGLIVIGIFAALFLLALCLYAQDQKEDRTLEKYREYVKVNIDKNYFLRQAKESIYTLNALDEIRGELPPRHDEEETLRKEPVRDKSDEEVFAEVEQVIKNFEL